MSLEVVVPFDWVGSVVVPSAAILVSSGIAVWVASFERRKVAADAVRLETSRLIRALAAFGRAFQDRDNMAMRQARRRMDEELSAFAANLTGRDAAVGKYVAVVVTQADMGPHEYVPRTMLWLVTALELWQRGELRSADFAENMPSDTSIWSDQIDLSEHQAVLAGRPAVGFPLSTAAMRQ